MLASKSSIQSFWKSKFGTVPKNFGAPFENHNQAGQPALVSCSNYIFKRPQDWNPHIHQYGYWIVDEVDSYEPPKELIDFLNAGEKPIYIGFGSMSMMKNHKNLGPIVVEALKKSGKRGIISGFGKPDNLTDDIYAIDSIPHTWLFKHVAAVCHHGGAGTSAAGFTAGIPSIIVPFSNDQFAWAHRSYDLGIGTKPIYAKDLDADKLAAAILEAYQPDIRNKAEQLGTQIKSENGAAHCAQVILDLLKQNEA